jgi:hypothetical protein
VDDDDCGDDDDDDDDDKDNNNNNNNNNLPVTYHESTEGSRGITLLFPKLGA